MARRHAVSFRTSTGSLPPMRALRRLPQPQPKAKTGWNFARLQPNDRDSKTKASTSLPLRRRCTGLTSTASSKSHGGSCVAEESSPSGVMRETGSAATAMRLSRGCLRKSRITGRQSAPSSRTTIGISRCRSTNSAPHRSICRRRGLQTTCSAIFAPGLPHSAMSGNARLIPSPQSKRISGLPGALDDAKFAGP